MLIVALLIAASQQSSPLPGTGNDNLGDNIFGPPSCTIDKECGYYGCCVRNICFAKRRRRGICYANNMCLSGECLLVGEEAGTCM